MMFEFNIVEHGKLNDLKIYIFDFHNVHSNSFAPVDRVLLGNWLRRRILKMKNI